MSDAEELRSRLREARREQQTPLDEAAYARIVAHVVQHGPGRVRRSHQRRVLVRAAAVVVPLVLITGVLLRGQRQPSAAVVAMHRPAACAARMVPRAEARLRADQTRSIDLGEVGQIVLEAGAVASLDVVDPCRLQLQLKRGRVSIHAANLFGGELKVQAGATDVVVHGTTFAVEQTDDEVLVDVETGAVSVERAGKPVAPLLRDGQRLRVAATHAPVLVPLLEAQQTQLRERFLTVPVAAVQQVERSRVVARSAEPRVPERAVIPEAAATLEPAPTVETSAPAKAMPARQPTAARAARQQPSAAAPVPVPASARVGVRVMDAGAWVARADALWQSGDLADARASYRAAGQLSGATAEAAWLSLARNELALGRTRAARAALAEHAQRFPRAKLAGEAAGIAFRVALQADDAAAAERSARRLVDDYPDTPQADAAARWLRARKVAPR